MTAVTSKMNRMVLLYMLALFMVSLPTSLAKHFLVETADNQRGDDYHRSPPRLPPSGGSDYRRLKKNYKKELTKIIDDMKRQGMDYGIMDILGTAWGFVKPMVKPAWEVVKPVVKEGAKALVGQLTKGELFMIPWSFIPIFRHSRQSRHFMTLFHQEI